MKKTKSRMLSLVLTVCMVLSLLPAAALAAETVDPLPEVQVEENVPLTPLTPAEPEPEEDVSPAEVAAPRAAGDPVYVHKDKVTTGHDGSFAKPYQTLTAAYAAVTTDGEIRVLSDLTVSTTTAFNAGKTVTISSYENETKLAATAFVITKGALNGNTNPLIGLETGTLTIGNVILDGGSSSANKSCLVRMAGANNAAVSSSLVLDGGILRNNYGNGDGNNNGGAVYMNTTGEFTMKSGEITGNFAVGDTAGKGGAIANTQGTFTMVDGEISDNKADLDGGAIYTSTNSTAITKLKGGTITGNVCNGKGTTGQGGAVMFNTGSVLTLSGNVNITGNTRGVVENNIYVNGESGFITIDTARMGENARVGVYTSKIPTKATPVKFATGANASDVAKFISDNATTAGIRLGVSGGSEAITDLYLDVAARVILNTDVTLDDSGKANITVSPTTAGTHYAILDKNGAVVTTAVTVTGGTNAVGTNWYTANGTGAMIFGGLDPANGPYQVVTSNSTATAPDGNSGTTTNTKAGDKLQFLYVKSDGLDTNVGIKSAPFKTVTHAFTKAAANTTVVIILLSNLETPFGNNTSNIPQAAGGTTIVTSEGGLWTMYRDCTSSTSATLSVSSVGAKIKLVLDNVILNGASDKLAVSKTEFGEVFIATGGEVVLRNHAKITNSATRAVNIHEGGVFIMEGGEISGNKAGVNTMWGGDNYKGIANAGGGVYACPKGTFIMVGGTITENTATAGAAGVFGEKGAIFKMSGSPKVFGNLKGAELSNVYLKDGQTITLTGRMADGAEVHVYVDPMPNATTKTAVIATAAQQADAKYFHSDKMTQAGVVFDADKIVLSYDARAKATGKVDKDGKGQMIVEAKADTKYQVTNKNGSAVVGVIVTDKSGDVITPDTNGWYTTDNGPLVFEPLELTKEYEVHSSTDPNPGTPTTGGGSTVKIPAVGENVHAKPEANNKVTIVIDPADPKLKYAVLDPDGNKVDIVGADNKGWVTGKGEKIVVELPGLPAGKEYTIVGVPSEDTVSTPENSVDGGEKVTAPAGGLTDVGSGDVSRVPDANGKDKIVLSPTSVEQEYGVRDPITGDITWQPGTGAGGADVVFGGLDPNKDYDVVTRTPGTESKDPSLPTAGVTVPKNPSAAAIGGKTEKNTTETPDDDATLTIDPTDPALDYGIVDKNGDPVPAPNNVWKPGGGKIEFPNLKPGEEYTIVTKPHAQANPATPSDAIGGLPVTTPVAPVGKPSADGSGTGTQAKREPNANAPTDKITIPAAEATAEYKFALKDKDGNYYKQDGTPNAPDPKVPVYIPGANAEIVFNHLPMDKEYEIVKLPATNPSGGIQLPATTKIPALPPIIGDGDATAGSESDGDAFITVNPTDTDYNYILVGPDGKALVITAGTGGSITFPNLMPGEEYKIVTELKTKLPPTTAGEDMTNKDDRAPSVTTPVFGDGSISAGKDTTVTPNKTQIVIHPSSTEVKYVITDEDGNVIAVEKGNGGALTIGGLDPNKEYTISTVPADSATPVKGDADYTPTEPSVKVTTPTDGTSDIPGGATKPALTPSTDSITISPTVSGKVYEVVDPVTGKVVDTVTGDGGAKTIGGLTSGKDYIVQVKDDVANGLPVILDKVTTSSGSASSGGGSSSSSNNATVTKPSGGTVTLSPKNPKPGDKVTITVKPDEGFTTDKVTVTTTPGGKNVELTDNGDGTYTYTQPKEKVSVSATFKKVTGDPDSNGVSDLLNTTDHMAYLKGNTAGNFAPAADMTRAEVAQMFYNLLKNKDNDLGGKASFSDVLADAWYAAAVNTLANIGVLEGYTDGTFHPASPISRAEFVAVATRFAAETTGSKTYTDVAADDWAAEAIGAASYYGWIGGYADNTFKPTANIARSEAVKVVNAMLGRAGDKTFIDKAEGLKTFPDVPKTDWAYHEIAEATNTHDYAKKDGVESWKN